MAVRFTRKQIWVARTVAILLDVSQMGLAPVSFLFIDDILDVIAAGFFVWLLGFHVAFLPTLVVEVVPGAELFPFWTAAVLFVTRGGEMPPPPAVPPGAPPGPPAGKVIDVTPVESEPATSEPAGK